MINVQADSSVNVPSLYITVLQYTHCISVKYIVFCYCRTQFFVRLFLTSVKLNLFYQQNHSLVLSITIPKKTFTLRLLLEPHRQPHTAIHFFIQLFKFQWVFFLFNYSPSFPKSLYKLNFLLILGSRRYIGKEQNYQNCNMSAGNMGKPQTHLTATYIKVLISEQPHIMIKSSEVKVLNQQIPCAAHLLSNILYSKHQNAVRTTKKRPTRHS